MADVGHLDFYLFHPPAGGLLFCGWVAHAVAPLLHAGEFVARFEGGEVRGLGMATLYPRPGLEARGQGMILFIEGDERPAGALLSVSSAEQPSFELTPTPSARELSVEDGAKRLAPLLPKASPALPDVILGALTPAPEPEPTPEHAAASEPLPEPAILPPPEPVAAAEPAELPEPAILPAPEPVAAAEPADEPEPEPEPEPAIASRPVPRLVRNLDAMVGRVMLQVDEVVSCPPGGVVLIGWLLARPGEVAGINLRSGERITPLDFATAVRIPRPGVIEAVGAAEGFDDVRCGFMVYVGEGYDPLQRSAVEVDLARSHEIGVRELGRPRLHGMPAIRHVLAESDAQFVDLAPTFDHVLGPAVARLNAERLAPRRDEHGMGLEAVAFGRPAAAPAVTIVIPLHGRLDFIELQCALFAADPALAATEILFVLDDPRLRRELENLAASVHARLGLAFTLLLHDRNLGFAPACNTGLRAARGTRVCFLNSDVFPQAPGWLPALGRRLDDNPALGVVGPMLLHEDGSVQHRGMEFRRLDQYGGWYFSRHVDLGLRPSDATGLRRCAAITGACMLLDTARVRALGGFDEGYVIGDFEDSDLCLRLAEEGLGAAVDLDVAMVHFGRRSQASAGERWRMNLILYNAWRHERRWGATLDAMAAP